ncbi:hypothetical protein Pmani_035450 [Petrolisthes manimaculis]|uniref:RNA-binding protein lark n=1 Tax=Petrolisthes manimaculis TaxID=1843537 RepID=A0AAE1TN71_9EUCA|nr:hypothetical protein Pmani_035450 [Petrolisthes manimaculis]
MPVRGNTFKIFVGNLSDRTSSTDIRQLFEEHGSVVEADVVKNYGFVHMEKENESKAAIETLNGHSLHGKHIVVEASTGARKGGNQKTKIFVGNVHKDAKVDELKGLFEVYGSVVEADILTNYAFLHMDDEVQAQRAIRELDGYELHGLRLRVQESTSRVRQQAGMGNPDMCYRCGSGGHWSKECPRDGRLSGGGGGGGVGGGRYPPPPHPHAHAPYHDRERGSTRGYGGGGGGSSRYDPYPPPPPSYTRERLIRYREEFDRFGRYDRYYDEGMFESRYGDPPPPLPPLPPPMMRDSMYDHHRRPPLPPLPPPELPGYLRYGRRSPPPPRSRGIDSGSRRRSISPPPHSLQFHPPPSSRGYVPLTRRPY